MEQLTILVRQRKKQGQQGTKGLGKGKNKAHCFGLYGPQPVNVLEGCNTDAEAALQDTWDCQENEHIGMLGKVSKVKPTKDCVSGRGTTSTSCRLITKSLRSKLILVAAETTQSLARIDA